MMLLSSTLMGNSPSCDKIIDMEYYLVCYNYDLKSPVAVTYRLTREGISGKGIRKRMSFRISREIPREHASCSLDFKGSKYDRGHLASDASFDKDRLKLRSTYYYANVVPMHRRVNRYYWSKVERFERTMAAKLKSITVTNIVVFDEVPKRIGKNGIAVPIGFYKLIESEDGNYSKCFYYKNSNEKLIKDKLKNHVVNCNEVVI